MTRDTEKEKDLAKDLRIDKVRQRDDTVDQ